MSATMDTARGRLNRAGESVRLCAATPLLRMTAEAIAREEPMATFRSKTVRVGDQEFVVEANVNN